MTKKTKHFKNCLGVFQGGGCKALAFVGAYRESVTRGVFFSRVAGTSAGAVVAALVAAGATPDYLENAVRATDFKSFKKAPDSKILASGDGVARAILALGSKKHRTIASFMKYFGIFSSAEIESWLELHLRKLLNKIDSGAVKFRDLNIPLHIVATELGCARPKVWSSETTPDESVAYAVRCSCTIPVYFQPVSSRFVDGGIVSNLPSFVLNDGQTRNFEKLLCFTFSPDKQESADSRASASAELPLAIEDYFKQLISAVIDGSVHIQSELQPNLHVIEIDKLPLGTVDFDKITEETTNEMFKAGERAAASFFDSEIANIRGTEKFRLILGTEPEALNQIVREETISGDEITISLRTTRYVYNLFPTLLHWSLSGVKVVFLTWPVDQAAGSKREKEHEVFRRLVLKALGIRVIDLSVLPFEAVLFGRRSRPGNAIVFHEKRADELAPCFAVKYEKTLDSAVIEALRTTVDSYQDEVPTQSPTPIKFLPAGMDELFTRLRNVEQYSSDGVRISLEEVEVDRILFLTRYVKSYKYNQIQKLFNIYKSEKFGLFDSVQICYQLPGGDLTMPITPPVAEEHGGYFYLFEGNSRLTYLIKEHQAKTVKLVVVRNVSTPLPTNGKFSSCQLLISDEDKKGSARYQKFDHTAYRSIEEAVRNPSFYKE